MADVNVWRLGTISVDEVIPFTIEFSNIPTQVGNELVKALRFDRAVSTDTGVDIAANCTVEANKVLVSNIWLADETPTVGNYKVKLVLKDSVDLVVKEELNAYIQVV